MQISYILGKLTHDLLGNMFSISVTIMQTPPHYWPHLMPNYFYKEICEAWVNVTKFVANVLCHDIHVVLCNWNLYA